MPQVVRRPIVVVEDLERIVQSTTHGEGLGEPESAQHEPAFIRRDSVVIAVAAQEPSLAEFLHHAVEGADDAGIVAGQKPVERHEQQRCVHMLRAVLADEGARLAVVAALENLRSQLLEVR